MDAPKTDLDDPPIGHGIELVDNDGVTRIVRHLVLQSAEMHVENRARFSTTEALSWDGVWVRLGSGCGSAVSCPECREELKRRAVARAALKAVS